MACQREVCAIEKRNQEVGWEPRGRQVAVLNRMVREGHLRR